MYIYKKMELSVSEMPQRILLGLKINVSTLEEKKVTIEEVRNLLHITDHYVIGLDTSLSVKQVPHYHLHFSYLGNYDAIQKLKCRKLKDFGKSTKLYQAKDKKESDPYCWYGYAVKEQLISKSADVDETPLKIHAHTQFEYRKSQIRYGAKIETKKVEKVTFEESLFDEIVYLKSQGEEPKRFTDYATLLSKAAFRLHKKILLPNRIEYYTWKYLLTHNIVSHYVYVREKMKEYDISYSH